MLDVTLVAGGPAFRHANHRDVALADLPTVSMHADMHALSDRAALNALTDLPKPGVDTVKHIMEEHGREVRL